MSQTDEERRILLDLRDQINGRKNRPRTTAVVSQSREVLKRFIELVSCPYSSVKIFVATHIKDYIKEFPDLEDDAINAVYDLCEDQDQKVRIQGYKAITAVSQEQKKWVKRNADVLVQLLQSDEQDEVSVVKAQLTSHLDMDTVVTLNVLCDQVVVSEDPADEEDQSMRDRLRSLVVDFIAEKAKKIILREAGKNNHDPEDTLIKRVENYIPRLPMRDANVLVKDILASLPSYARGTTSYSSQGEILLKSILSGAEASYKSEKPQGGAQAPMAKTRHYLELASYIALEKELANPSSVIRFLCPGLVSKGALEGFTEDFQVFVIDSVARSFSKARGTSKGDADPLANIIMESLVPLLTSFANVTTVGRPWVACKILLQACDVRKNESKWTSPSKLLPILQKVQAQAGDKKLYTEEETEVVKDVQNLTRSLIQVLKPPQKSTASSSTNLAQGGPSNDRKPNGSGPVQIRRRFNESGSDGRGSLPPRPPQSTPQSNASQRRMNTPSSMGQRFGNQQQSNRRDNTASTPGISARNTPAREAESSSSSRRKKVAEEGSVPSLLSRLAVSTAGDASQPTVPAKRRAEHETSSAKRQNTHGDATSGGLSIKGAAAKASRPSPPHDQPSSLLDRLRVEGNERDGGGINKRGKPKT